MLMAKRRIEFFVPSLTGIDIPIRGETLGFSCE